MKTKTLLFFKREKPLNKMVKRSTLILLLFCMSSFGFTTNNFSQNEKVIIKNNMVMPISKVFDAIKSQTTQTFIYNPMLFNKTQAVALSKGTFTVKELLTKISKDTGLTYFLTDEGSVVFQKKQIQKTISGRVTDTDGMPLSGVAVLVNITEKATETDHNGMYKIEAKKGDKLSFHYMGFADQIIVVDDQVVINVEMVEDVTDLEEVIVTGYQQISVNKSTGSVNNVVGNKLKRKGLSNAIQSLEGQVAGLTLLPDPTGNGKLKFNIRGISTLEGNATPLIVVDGFPLEGSTQTINPYEVESVTILKDAAATSIYGARSANGVIVITTKRGEKDKAPNVSYRSVVSVTPSPDVAYRLNRPSSSELVDIQTNATNLINKNELHTYKWAIINDPSGIKYYTRANSLVYDALAMQNEGSLTSKQVDNIFQKLRNTDNTNQIQKYFYRPSLEQQHNISVSGGGNKNTYRVSLNYTRNQFRKKGTDSDRLIFDALNTFELGKTISVDLAGNVTLNKESSIPINMEDIFNINSYENFIDSNGNHLPVRYRFLSSGTNNSGLYGGKDPAEIQRLKDKGLLDESYYPLKELNNYNQKYENIAIRLQARLNAQLTESLSGNLSFQYETGSNLNKNIRGKESFEMKHLINNTTPLSYTGDENELNIPFGDRVIQTDGKRNSYTLRGQLDFHRIFGEHEITALAGSEIRHVFNSGITTDKFGYDDSTLQFHFLDKKTLKKEIKDVYHPEKNIAGGIPFRDSFTETTNRYFSLYGNASYGFRNKYIIAGNIRIDQSNLFGTDPKYRYKPFWSVSGKWRLGSESFMSNSGINTLDIRASYGVNGNISNAYGPFDIARSDLSYFAGDAKSLYIETPAVPNLRWEKTTTTDIGLDISFLNNKISLGLDYYIKDTKDLISTSKADPTLGFYNLVFNDANITNKGVEVSLNTINIENQNFGWSTFITFSHNKNKVTRVFSDEDYSLFAAGIRNYEGFPVDSYWLFDYQGLNNKGEPTFKNRMNKIITIDENFIDPYEQTKVEDLIYAGTTQPKYTGSITNNIRYKGFGLSFMFVGSGGHVLLKDSYNGQYINQNPYKLNKDVAKAWKKPGDEAITNIPKTNTESYYTESIVRNSTKNIIDGDYIRLRELIFTYDISGEKINKNVKNIGFSLIGNNLFYVAKNKEGIDPEAHGNGVRYFPVKPTYSLGVNVNF